MPVHNDHIRRFGQLQQYPAQQELGCSVYIEPVNRAMGCHRGIQVRGAGTNVLQRGNTRPVAQFFRIIDGGHKAFGGAGNRVRREDHQPKAEGAGKGAPADLVDTGNPPVSLI